MECKTCSLPMLIINGKHKIEGDDSPDTPTKLFYVQTTQCSKCKRTETISNEIKLEE